MTLIDLSIDPELDLVLEREVTVSRELVWQAWTTPDLLKKWFTPAPWKTVECQMDLRPGGIFRTVIQSPDGETQPPTNACILEVVENEKLVWTDALHANYRPALAPNECFDRFFSATVLFEPTARGTRYRVIARHNSSEAARSHEKQGFSDGWGTALEQMIRLIKAGELQPVS